VVNAAIEEVLIDCLEHPDLRGRAAWHLGQRGYVRSIGRLRRIPDGGLDDI
jgi:hypothetical protein